MRLPGSQIQRESFVGIYKGESPIGAGVYARANGEAVLVSCAHVVNLALGRSMLTQDRPKDQTKINIRFTLLDAHKNFDAVIEEWCPPLTKNNVEEPVHDVAVLKLCQPPPDKATPATFLLQNTYEGIAAKAFGFPKSDPSGRWSLELSLSEVNTLGDVQIDQGPRQRFPIRQGFSGAGVAKDVYRSALPREGLFGIVWATDKLHPDPTIKPAFMIPTQKLVYAYPDLKFEQVNVQRDQAITNFRHQSNWVIIFCTALAVLTFYWINTIEDMFFRSESREFYTTVLRQEAIFALGASTAILLFSVLYWVTRNLQFSAANWSTWAGEKANLALYALIIYWLYGIVAIPLSITRFWVAKDIFRPLPWLAMLILAIPIIVLILEPLLAFTKYGRRFFSQIGLINNSVILTVIAFIIHMAMGLVVTYGLVLIGELVVNRISGVNMGTPELIENTITVELFPYGVVTTKVCLCTSGKSPHSCLDPGRSKARSTWIPERMSRYFTRDGKSYDKLIEQCGNDQPQLTYSDRRPRLSVEVALESSGTTPVFLHCEYIAGTWPNSDDLAVLPCTPAVFRF